MSPTFPDRSPKILVVRRDNIGDLVCTTPLLRALRERLPQTWIGVLANSYNAPVLEGNPDIDELFAYTKAKHRGIYESLPGILWRRLALMRRLRSLRLDDVILAASPTPQRQVDQMRWLKPRRLVGFGAARGLDVSLPPDHAECHEVEDIFRLARLYGIDETPPPCRVVATGVAPSPTFSVAIHISARKPSQRWPAERFAELMRRLTPTGPMRFILLWSPGDEDNPLHPGDDAKARQVLDLAGDSIPVTPCPTRSLRDLINAIAECHLFIGADGGAMHLAAGLGLPIVCLFGQSGATRWRPWGVPYRVLQKPSLDVSDIPVEDVVAAFNALSAGIPAPSAANPP